MNRSPTTTGKKAMSAYNMAVMTAYFKIVKETKRMLSAIFQHELRCTLQRSNKVLPGFGSTIHELVNPLLYLSLECNDREKLTIHFGIELFHSETEYSAITAKFVRLLYRLTSIECTTVNIEDCISTEYIITACSELYETIEDSHNKQHSFSLIAYKPTASKRKRMRAVA